MPRKLPPLDFDNLHRRYEAGESIPDIAVSVGIGETTLGRHLRRRGYDLRLRRPDRDWAALHRRYVAGESMNDIAVSLGVTRTTIGKHFKSLGFPLRTASEAKRLHMARYSAADRKRIASKAHAARRGNVEPFERTWRRAGTVEARQLHISPLDRDLLGLLGRGTLQKAIGPYNCDVAFDPIAVEVFGGAWHASGRAAARHVERTRYILNRGWHLVIIWVENSRYPLTVAAADYVIALSKAVRRDPPSVAQYRVIRGTGQEIVVGCAKDNKFPVKPPRERRVQVRCRHHR